MDECISETDHPENVVNAPNIESIDNMHISLENSKCGESNLSRSLHEKLTIQQKEVERLEEQNAAYREKLIRVIRERDMNEDLLKSIKDEHKKEKYELEKKIHESDVQLKAVQDCAAAQEGHYSVLMKDLSVKYNISIGQITKKSDQAEKEKNEAVIKYAVGEAELMRLRAEMQKKDQELRDYRKLMDELQKSQGQGNLDRLEKESNLLKAEVEQFKLEKSDLENKFRMSEKRVEASQTSITELKQQCDALRKQLIQIKDDRNQVQEEYRQLLARFQVQEQSDHENKLSEATEEIIKLRESNNRLKTQLDEANGENIDLLSKLQDLEDKFLVEENAHAADRLMLSNIKQIQDELNRSKEIVDIAKAAQEQAEKEREIAEKEAEDCRLQAERMLQITEQLTQRNTKLAGEAEQVKEENRRIGHLLIEAESALTKFQLNLAEREKDLDKTRELNDTETKELKEALNEKVAKVQELNKRLIEEQNDHIAYKKKHTASMKELKHELNTLKKQLETDLSEGGSLAPPVMDSAPSTSSRSRTSSLTSLDRVTEEEINISHSVSLGGSSTTASIQQAMVDKIVILQKKLERKSEKVDFLEEHVRQCLEELQKKTKVIQHYALREEASLLLPSDEQLFKSCEVVQVPLVKKGTSYGLMGSVFTSVGEKKSVQLVTEINSRLQAVLEDALLKNITLKASVDALGNEVSRLSRENRQLRLTQKTSG